MYTIFQTETFSKWLAKLKDLRGKVAVARRIERAQTGNLGDVKSVGEEVWEMRIPVGAGYRAYYTKEGDRIIILLCGGDKSTQERDIRKAGQLAKEVKNDPPETV